MATGARSGFGSLLKRGDGATPEVYTTVAEVVDIGEVSITQATADGTHMESAGRFMEKIPTLLEAGSVSVSLNFLPGDTTQNLLRADMVAGTTRNFQITVPGTSKVLAFAAIVTKWGPSIPHDGKMTQTIELTPTGVSTFA